VCHIFVQFYTELSSGRKEALKLEWIQSAAAKCMEKNNELNL